MKFDWYNLPAWVDRWRLFPRAFMVTYLWLIIQTAMWFMGLPSPSTAQAGFASAIIAAGAAWLGLYLQAPPKQFGNRASKPTDNPKG